jgi:glycosyltransferase involved in cell wall biosynthesis
MIINKKNVLIGIPVKNCAPWLETTVKQIINLDYNKENLSIVFVENDSEDNSFAVIEYCIHELLSKYRYRSIKYEKKDIGFKLPHESRHDFRHMDKRMNSLKTIRNHIVDNYLTDNGYIWWVDADYQYIPPNFLIESVNFGTDIIMPRVEVNDVNYDGMTHAIIDGVAVPIDKVASRFDDTFYRMNIVECAALISRRVFDSGLRYDSGIIKENDGTEHFLQEGPHFSYRAKLSGFKLYGSLKHVIIHQPINGTIPYND